MEFYNGIFSSDWQFAALAFCALLIGFSKTGIQGAVVVSIPMMALAFGAKESTGVILPMLCFADLIAVAYYRRDADWRLDASLCAWAKKDARFGPGLPPKAQAAMLGFV